MPDLPNDPTPNQPTVSFGPVDRSETLGYRQDPADASPNAFDAPTVPGYDIAGELGRGGMGVVYRAHEFGLNRTVALKMVLAGTNARTDELIRFLAEAETAAKLQHQGIAQIFGSGRTGGLPYFAMEYVDGGSLADKLTAGPLPPADAARLGRQLAEAVAHAHAAGVVHRDLKPANILLTTDGVPKITDFGLARRLEGGDGLTRTGAISGTPSYMPPEQARGDLKSVGPAGDVYALGAVLYECLTGRPPFKGANPAETLRQVLDTPPARLRSINTAVPRDLETVALKCLEKDPNRRYPSAEALAADLDRWLDGRPVTARRVGSVGQAWRWAKRNPTVAGLLTAVLLVFAVGATVSAFFAVRADERASEAQDERRKAAAALTDVDAARDVAQRQVVRFDILTAAQQAERNEPELALNWVARAWQDDVARLKPGQQLDPGAEANHRLRVAVATDRLPQLVGFCPHDKPVVDGHSDPTGDRVVTVAATLEQDKNGGELWTERREHVARVWDAARAKLAYPPLTHDGPVKSVVFSADGSRIATASADGTARVWDAATGKLLHTFRPGGPVARVAFRPDGTTLAAAVGESIHRWAVATGEPIGEPVAAGGPTDYIAYSPEGSKFVTVTLAGKARVWDAATGMPLSDPLPFFRFGEKEFRAAIDFLPPMESQRWPAFSADGKQLATADGYRIHLWAADRVRAIELGNLPSQQPKQIQSAFTADGTRLVYVQRLGTAFTVLDLATDKPVATGNTARLTCGLAVSPDGVRAAVPVSAGNTWLFDVGSAVIQGPALRINDGVTQAWFTRDSKRLVTASWDGTVRVWEPAAAGRPPEPYDMGCGRADRLEYTNRRFSPDGKRVAEYDVPTKQLRVGAVGGELAPLPRPVIASSRLGPDGKTTIFDKFMARFAPTGRHLATIRAGTKPGSTAINSWAIDATAPEPVGEVAVDGIVSDLAFSGDGRRLAVSVRSPAFKSNGTGSNVDQFFVFDFPSLTRILGPVGDDLIRLRGQLVLDRTGDLLVVTQEGLSRIPCWDVPTGRRLPGGAVGPGSMYSVEVGPQDSRVLAPVSDRTVGQWDARSGRRVGPTISLPSNAKFQSFSSCCYDQTQSRVVQINRISLKAQRLDLYSAGDGDLLTSFTESIGADSLAGSNVWFSVDGRRVIAHRLGTELTSAWTLPECTAPLEQVPALVRLLTGTRVDPVGGFVPLAGDAIRTDPETYRRAFRAWKGLPAE